MGIIPIKQQIQEYFCINPTVKLRVRQIERVVQVPLPSVIRYTKELEQVGILQRVVIGEVTFYSANRNSAQFLLEKKLFNLRQLFCSGLIDFFKKELGNPVIIVFGSYARGEDIEGSDIDMYVETTAKKKIKLEKYEEILKRKIQLFVYKHITGVENKELANNIINGVVVQGFIEVFHE